MNLFFARQQTNRWCLYFYTVLMFFFSSVSFSEECIMDGAGVSNLLVWDSGGIDNQFSTAENWLGDTSLISGMSAFIDTSNDDVIWDIPSGLMNITVSNGFLGTLSPIDNLDSGLVNCLKVDAGSFITNSVISTNKFELGTDAVLVVRLDSINIGEHGKIEASDIVRLSGTLRIEETISEAAGQVFDLLNWASLEGQFHHIDLPKLSSGLVWNLSNLYVDGTVAIIPAPGNINITPELWLSAKDSQSLVSDAANQVSLWIDQSGSNSSLTQTDTTKQPTVMNIENLSHSFPVVRFDGVDDHLPIKDNIIQSSDYTVIVVEARNNGNSHQYFLSGNTQAAMPNGLFGYLANDALIQSHEANDLIVPVQEYQETIPRLNTFVLDQNLGKSIYIDGDIIGTNTSTDTVSEWLDASVGGSSQAGYYGGDIAEIIIYNTALSELERQSVESYLAAKYQLPSPVIWDGGASEKSLSIAENWLADVLPTMGNQLIFNHSNDDINWNTSVGYHSVSLKDSFSGVLSVDQQDSVYLSDLLLVQAGTLSASVPINTNNYIQETLGNLQLDIIGREEPAYGRINASGSVTLSGRLDVNSETIILQIGDQFDLLNGTINGTFSEVVLPTLTPGLTWNDSALYSTGIITIVNDSVTWVSQAGIDTFSGNGWGGNITLTENWGVVIDSSSDIITWDSPATLAALSLTDQFSGIVLGQADSDLTVSNTVSLSAGAFSVDSVVMTDGYEQNQSGHLILTLDSKTDAEYGRISASHFNLQGGQLTILNDGLTFVEDDEFMLLDGNIVGEFSGINLPNLPVGLAWDLSELYTNGVLKIQQTMVITINTEYGLTVDLRLYGTLSDVVIDWGDGHQTLVGETSGLYRHTYASSSLYDAQISGYFTGYGWQNQRPIPAHVAPITRIHNWKKIDNIIILSDLSGAFSFHKNLISVPSELPSNVTDLSYVFLEAAQFNQAIGVWDVSNVTAMNAMFRSALQFDADISSWDVSNVVDMDSLFRDAKSFNQDIGQWNVSSVENMRWMFSGATSFDHGLSNWNVSQVMAMDNMLLRTTLSSVHYDALLLGWSQLSLKNNISFHGGDATYTSGSTAEQSRTQIMSQFGWRIKDGGPSTNTLTWSATGIDSVLASFSEWNDITSPSDIIEVALDTSQSTIVWDSPDTLYSLTLSANFGGVVKGGADTDLTVVDRLSVNTGVFSTDAVITSREYLQGVNGALTLIIDDKTDGQYGRIVSEETLRFSGHLSVNIDNVDLVEGDRFDLFDANHFLGSFATIDLPPLATGLVWNLNELYTLGVITVDTLLKTILSKSTDHNTVETRVSELLQLPDVNRTFSGYASNVPSLSEWNLLDPNVNAISHINALSDYQPGQYVLYWLVLDENGDQVYAEQTYTLYLDENRAHSDGFQLKAYQGLQESHLIDKSKNTVTLKIKSVNESLISDITWDLPIGFATDSTIAQTDEPYSKVIVLTGVNPGIYTVNARLHYNNDTVLNRSLHLKIEASTSLQTDFMDTDDDYLPYSFDQTDSAQRLQAYWGSHQSEILETDRKHRLSLGVEALAIDVKGVQFDLAEAGILFEGSIPIENSLGRAYYKPPVKEYTEQLFYSVEIHDLDGVDNGIKEPAGLVIPMKGHLSEDSKVEIYTGSEWLEFYQDEFDSLYSMNSDNEFCPKPDAKNYQKGLMSGANCLLVMVSDGGHNDRDQTADGKTALFMSVITNPDDAAIKSDASSSVESGSHLDSDGSSGGSVSSLLLFVLLLLLIHKKVYLSRTVVFVD